MAKALVERQIDAVIAAALAEDVDNGVDGKGEDVTAFSTIPPTAVASAVFLAKDNGVVAGCAVATLVFQALDKSVQVSWSVRDGDRVTRGQRLGTVHGLAHAVLRGERVALNLMQRMSGIATATRAMVDAVRPHKALIIDTRKTAPGMRHLDKLAVVLGGGTNHRIGLWDMVLIKDNHVDVAGGVRQALERTHAYLTRKGLLGKVPVEIEVRSIKELTEVLEAMKDPSKVRVDRILLDNFAGFRDGAKTIDTSLLTQAVKLVNGRVPLEASGNVTIATVHDIAATGVDMISSGSMTHSVKAMDISMKISEIKLSSKL